MNVTIAQVMLLPILKKGLKNIAKAINYLDINNWKVDIISPLDTAHGRGNTKYYQYPIYYLTILDYY